MKRIALVTALCLVLAGCASAPEKRPAEDLRALVSRPAPAAQAGGTGSPAQAAPGAVPADRAPAAPTPTNPAQAAPASAPATLAPVTPTPAAQAPAAPAQAAPAQVPATQAPVAPASPSDRLQGLTRVDLPAPGDLGNAYRDPERMNQSAWGVAEAGLHFIYTGRPGLDNALAPALVSRFQQTPPVTPAARVWTTFVSSWEEGGRYYFHLQVTARTPGGLVQRAGVDVIEVSHVPGYGNLVTGFAHAPWASEQQSSPVKVWTGAGPDAYQAPREVPLTAPPLAEGGTYLVPLNVVSPIGHIKQVGEATYVVELAAGAKSGELTAVMRNGLPYVAVVELTAALSGRRGALPDASGSYSYQAEWDPATRQLFLWADEQHRMS